LKLSGNPVYLCHSKELYLIRPFSHGEGPFLYVLKLTAMYRVAWLLRFKVCVYMCVCVCVCVSVRSGTVMAVTAGLLFGLNFTPVIYIQQHREQYPTASRIGKSLNTQQTVFSHNDQLGCTNFPYNALSPQCIIYTYVCIFPQ